MAELSKCDRNRMVHKHKIFTIWKIKIKICQHLEQNMLTGYVLFNPECLQWDALIFQLLNISIFG